MMKMKAKIRSSKGETLVETLVAMTIVSLVSGLLFVMITGTHQLNTQSIQSDEGFYNQLTVAEMQTNLISDTDTATIRYGTNLTSSYEAEISIYGTIDGLLSYKEKGGPP